MIEKYNRNAFNRVGSDLKMAGVPWIIPGWLAAGEVHILAGAAKTGKSQLAISLAALLSSGKPWYEGGDPLPVSRIGYYSTEEDTNKVLLPRFIAAGGDTDNIHLGTTDLDGATHLDEIRGALLDSQFENRPPLKLIVVDGVASAVSNINDASEVRTYLYQVKAFAKLVGAAVMLITHTAKGGEAKYTKAQDFVIGTQAWVAVPRMVWVMVRDIEKDNKAALLVRTGNLPHPMDGGLRVYGSDFVNLGKDEQGLEITTSKISSVEVLTGEPNKLFAKALGVKAKEEKEDPDEQEATLKMMLMAVITREVTNKNPPYVIQKLLMDEMDASASKVRSALASLEREGRIFHQNGINGTPPNQKWWALDGTKAVLGGGLDKAEAKWAVGE